LRPTLCGCGGRWRVRDPNTAARCVLQGCRPPPAYRHHKCWRRATLRGCVWPLKSEMCQNDVEWNRCPACSSAPYKNGRIRRRAAQHEAVFCFYRRRSAGQWMNALPSKDHTRIAALWDCCFFRAGLARKQGRGFSLSRCHPLRRVIFPRRCNPPRFGLFAKGADQRLSGTAGKLFSKFKHKNQ